MTPILYFESSLPAMVRLSSGLAAGEITAKEYNGAQRVAAMEDSTKKLFYRARWSQVEEGDTVLVAEHDYIGEAHIIEIRNCSSEGQLCMKVVLNPIGSARHYQSACWPDSTVYVQSRF
jgi:hypothetical protein